MAEVLGLGDGAAVSEQGFMTFTVPEVPDDFGTAEPDAMWTGSPADVAYEPPHNAGPIPQAPVSEEQFEWSDAPAPAPAPLTFSPPPAVADDMAWMTAPAQPAPETDPPLADPFSDPRVTPYS